MDLTILLVVLLAFLIAGSIKGVIGMGLPMTSIAIMGSVLELRAAVPIAVIPVILFNLWQIALGPGAWQTFKRLFWLNLFACAGIWVGVQILLRVESEILSLILGILICVYVALNLIAVEFSVPRAAERWLAPPVGFAGGIMCGAVGSLVVPVVFYLQAMKLDKDAFIQAVGMVFFLTALPWFSTLWAEGAITWQSAQYSAAALVPGALGMLGGTWLRGKISQEAFRKAIFVALFILGVNLIRKAIF